MQAPVQEKNLTVIIKSMESGGKNVAKADIYYLYHSGFAVETENCFLVFDYYRDRPEGSIRSLSHGVVTPSDLVRKEQVLVFSSHSHGDHYNPVILDWRKSNPSIQYIFSHDIRLPKGDAREAHILQMRPYEELSLDSKKQAIRVKSFGSTDIGISFWVDVDGLHIFHAGDLNWWHWKEESTEDEIREAEADFNREMKHIEGQDVDIAFFPVDPRLGAEYYLGAQAFIDRIHPRMLVPMHFGDDTDITGDFKKRMEGRGTIVVEITGRGQHIPFR